MNIKNSKPLVTIYIPCSNYGKYLSQALDSVLSQSYKNWELFIINDGSTDNTQIIAETYALKSPNNIFIINNHTPTGLQKIANTVLKKARGNFILRLDADDWLDESALLILIDRATKSDCPSIVYGGYYYVDTHGRIIGLESQDTNSNENLLSNTPGHGACALIRTRSLRAVGGYSEDINAQDGWDLWFKIAGRRNIATVATPIFFYRQHTGSLSSSNKRLFNARVKIFSNLRKKISGMYQPSILVVIPVRESYPNFKGVPYINILKKSLLERAILQAQDIKEPTNIMISSSSEKVLEFARKLELNGQVKPHMRKLREGDISGDYINLQKILFDCGIEYESRFGNPPDIVVSLSIHSILRNTEVLNKGIDSLIYTEVDTVVSVVEERSPIFINDINKLRLVGSGRFDNLYRKNEQLFRFNGIFMGSWWDIIQNGACWGENIGYVEMPGEDSILITNDVAVGKAEAFLA